MKKHRFVLYLVLQVLTIIVVTLLFRLIEDRRIASTTAGFLFVSLPLALMLWEIKASKLNEKIWLVATLQFLILFALPIISLRLFNWDTPFDQLSLWGITGPFLHEWSSRSYFVWMIVTFITLWKERKKQKS